MPHKCPEITGTSDDPEFRRERARLAGKKAQAIDTYVRVLVRRAPELTDDHRSQLRQLLDGNGGRDA